MKLHVAQIDTSVHHKARYIRQRATGFNPAQLSFGQNIKFHSVDLVSRSIYGRPPNT